MKHTREPWEAHQADPFGSFRIAPSEIWLGACSSLAKGEQGANAARIVECVNACAGIENPGEAIPAARRALELALEVIEATGPGSYPDAETIISEALAKLKGDAE
jgi:hypothetical protein